MKKVMSILLAVLFVVSMTAMAASALGGSGEDGGYGPGGVYDTPYSAGSPNDYYAAMQPETNQIMRGDTYSR